MTAIAASGLAAAATSAMWSDGVGHARRKVDPHHRAQFAAIEGDEHERFLGDEAEHGGQRRDQGAGPVEQKVGL